MGLESATFISQLDNANPLGGDPINQGDDHIRLVKAVLQSQFPNLTAAAINATIVEFNVLAGLLASTAELNIMNGALLSTAELNTLNGILSSTAELNSLSDFVGTNNRALRVDGFGKIVVSLVTDTELNILDGLLASTAELNKLNGLLASTAELDTMDGILSTTSELNRLQSYIGTIDRALVSDASGNIVVSPVTVAELNILDGLVSSTTELNRLQSFVGTASRAVVTDGSGNLVVSLVTTTELNLLDGLLANATELNILDGATLTTAELNFVDGVTSLIQTQLNGKALSAHSHTGAEISALDAGDTTTGVFALARIPTIDTANIAASAIGRSQIANSVTTTAGTLGAGGVLFALNNWALFPMVHAASTFQRMTAHTTDGSSASSPRFRLVSTSGSFGYDVDHRWIIAA